jgi:hypothetical protein
MAIQDTSDNWSGFTAMKKPNKTTIAAMEELGRGEGQPMDMGDDQKLSDLGNELHNLACTIHHTNEEWANEIERIAIELWFWGVTEESAHD